MNKLKTITWHEQRLYGLNGRHETTAEACHSSTKHKASGFAGKRILLLQGPVGPFFWNLAKDLRSADATIFKFNFNAGDWLFYPRGASSFRGELPQWPAVLEAFIVEHQIDAVLIFGDCRPVHRCVPALTERLGCALGVFEEGYLRPDHVTFEPRGVNGHSNFHEHLAARLKQRSRMGLALSSHAPEPSGKPWKKVGNSFGHAATWGFIYFFVAWVWQWHWNNALHHRRMTARDAPWWCLSYLRKLWYRHAEKQAGSSLLHGNLRRKFFLVPLQVYNDPQILVHSDFEGVADFIGHLMCSFSHALAREQTEGLPESGRSIVGDVLVFKHHPMDRGHRNYARIIHRLSQRYGLEGRVLYIHDQHLPSLLKSAKGVVLVNSTTGLSALGHGAPVKVCGKALYDLPKLTYQGPLKDFWFLSQQAKPDKAVLLRFRDALIECTQLNGSFYRKLPDVPWQCGVALNGRMAPRLWRSGHLTNPACWPECGETQAPAHEWAGGHLGDC